MSAPALRLFAGEVEATRQGGAWLVEETDALRLEIPGGPWQVRLEGRELPWEPRLGPHGGVRAALPFAIGRLSLEVYREGRTHHDTIEVRPAAHKLGASRWAALLADLEGWLPSVTAGIEAPRLGGLSLAGLDLPSAVEALLPLLPGFEQALRQVFERPRTRERTDVRERPIHRARQPRPETLAWISAHPREAAWLRPEAEPSLVGAPPLVPLPVQRDVLDHPANRHLVWLVGRIVRRLQGAATALSRTRCSRLNDTEAWRDARVWALQRAARHLARLLRTSPLSQVQPQPASGEALMVLLDAPAYARAHQLGRRILSSGFSSQSTSEVATRPSFTLYELWCLLALQRALRDWLGPAFTWRFQGTAKLLDLSSDGTGATLTATEGERTVELRFNPVFRSLLDGPAQRFSVTEHRRPDVTLCARGPGGAAWWALDAKYRAGRTALADAFGKAHIYQHSLRWPAWGGAPRATWLLAPSDAETAPWFGWDFLHAHHVGALRLCPGTDLLQATVNLRRMVGPLLEIEP